MRDLWGQGVVEKVIVGEGWGRSLLESEVEVEDEGGEVGSVDMGVVFVGEVAMIWEIKSGTRAGVTSEMRVKAGRRRIVVGLSCASRVSVVEVSGGVGMLEALSISFCTLYVSHAGCFLLRLVVLMLSIGRSSLTPLLGSPSVVCFHFPTASITLPASSVTSRTQSVLPVATSICVSQPLIWP